MRALPLLVLLLFSPAAAAAPKPPWAAHGVVVTLHVPWEACERNVRVSTLKRQFWTCTAAVGAGGRVTLAGREDWQTLGPPTSIEINTDKWRWSGRQGTGTLTLEAPGLEIEVVMAAPDEDAALTALGDFLTYGRAWLKAAKDRRLQGLEAYAGALLPADLVPEPATRLSLLAAGESVAGTKAYALVEYREGRWLAFTFGRGAAALYNDRQTSQVQRVATEVTQRLLPVAKAAGPSLAATTASLAGLALRLQVGHVDFLRTYLPGEHDVVELYLPRDLVIQYAGDDITSQALIDGSILLIDGQRTQVRLADAVGD